MASQHILFLACIGGLVVQDTDKITANVMYCKKHPKPVPMLPCMVFDGITVGYYCVSCYSFLPIDNPEIEVIKRLLVLK